MTDDARARFVCVVGIDGSGKTTLAKGLTEDLRDRGLDAAYVWCRFESKVLAQLLDLYNIVSHGSTDGDYEVNVDRKRTLFQGTPIGDLYEWFVLRAYRRQINETVVDELESRDIVIVDRYIYDTVVDLKLDLGFDSEKIGKLTSDLLDDVPTPDDVLYLDVSEEVAFERKDDVPQPSYLTRRKDIYEIVAESEGFQRLDGEQDPTSVRERALASLRTEEAIRP